MLIVQKKIMLLAILLSGLTVVTGCIVQNQSRATAEGQNQPTGLREQVREKVRDRVDQRLDAGSSSTANTTVTIPPTPIQRPQSKPPLAQAPRPNRPAVNREQLVELIGDQVATRISQSSCSEFQSTLDRLKAQKTQGGSNSAKRKRVMDAMKANPELRTSFINKVAGPVANKMFDCGLIPLE
jgi:hypothetical protein